MKDGRKREEERILPVLKTFTLCYDKWICKWVIIVYWDKCQKYVESSLGRKKWLEVDDGETRLHRNNNTWV